LAALALSAKDIEWIIPGESFLPGAPRFIAQGDRVLIIGFATARIKATDRTFEDHWVFAITVRNGKVTNIREYVDTQTRASETAASSSP